MSLHEAKKFIHYALLAFATKTRVQNGTSETVHQRLATLHCDSNRTPHKRSSLMSICRDPVADIMTKAPLSSSSRVSKPDLKMLFSVTRKGACIRHLCLSL